jgi:flagellar capping protein FliD
MLVHLFGCQKATKNLVDALEGSAGQQELSRLDATQKELDNRYESLLKAIKAHFQAVETALTQCQDIQDAIDSQVNWLNQLETTLR